MSSSCSLALSSTETAPYLALVTFVLGHIYRYVYDQYGWIPVSSQRLERRLLMWGVLLLASGLVDGSPGQPGGRGARRWLLKEARGVQWA